MKKKKTHLWKPFTRSKKYWAIQKTKNNREAIIKLLKREFPYDYKQICQPYLKTKLWLYHIENDVRMEVAIGDWVVLTPEDGIEVFSNDSFISEFKE